MKIIPALISLIVLFSVLTGCSGQNEPDELIPLLDDIAVTEDTVEEQPESDNSDEDIELTPLTLALRLMTTQYSDDPRTSEEYLEWLEKVAQKHHIGVTVNFIETTLQGNFNEKFNIMVSSGDMPDAIVVDYAKMRTLYEAGMLADLTDAFEKNADQDILNIYNSYPDNYSLDTATIDGALVGLPRAVPISNNVLWIRTDWLKKLGLEKPRTMEDIKNVARAFVNGDPNGTGLNDIVGLPLNGDFFTQKSILDYGADLIFGSYGVYPGCFFKDEEGEIYYSSTTDEAKAVLEELASMYKEGLLPRTFMDFNQMGALLRNGKAGMAYGSWNMPGTFVEDCLNLDPDGEWEPIIAPLREDSRVHLPYYTSLMTDASNEASFLVVSKKYQYPDAVVRLFNDQETNFKYFESFTLQNQDSWSFGFGTAFPPEALYYDNLQRQAKAMLDAVDTNNLDGLSSYYTEISKAYMDMQSGLSISNKAYSGVLEAFYALPLQGDSSIQFVKPLRVIIPEEMTSTWNKLQALENQTYKNIIMNIAPVDSFDAFVEEWNESGGSALCRVLE